MNRLIFVVFSLLFAPLGNAAELNTSLQQIEAEWARAYYATQGEAQESALDKLLTQTEAVAKQYPNRAEPLIWQAIVVSTCAAAKNGFAALDAIHQARDLLLQAIRIDPAAMDGAAYVNLGSLYYMVPGWPIAFGDDEKAEEMFQAALKIKPDSLDANYFYGDFLLSQGKIEQAVTHFKIALAAPVRREQQFADRNLQNEAKQALNTLQPQKDRSIKHVFPVLSSSAGSL